MSVAKRRGPRPASERLRRLLVMVPWVMERGEVPLAEVAARFQLTEAEVLADLERVAMCGLPPYEPGDLVDLFVDEGVVYAGIPRFFTRPLRLTTPEAFALLAAGRAALQLPGAEPGGPLDRALGKLEIALGGVGLDVEMARPPFADEIARAVDTRAELRLTYYSARSGATGERVVRPLTVFTDRGHWYVLADDVATGEERRLRIDRIEALEPTGGTFEGRPVVTPVTTGWFVEGGLPSVTLELAAEAGWIIERYPTSAVVDLGGGRQRVELPVSSEAWLARLLLRAGGTVRVVAPDDHCDLAARAAAQLVARYR